jgi:hypothetical protein
MDSVLGTLNQSERADVGMADTVLPTPEYDDCIDECES